MKVTNRNLIPIYTSKGDLGAFLVYPHLFNYRGEWIGWVIENREVYSVLGTYVGWLSDDPRILRRRSYDFSKPRKTPPQPPSKITVPASVPLAPMMSELTYGTVDVLEEEPHLLSPIDAHELKEDMD
jgi:hypothetical protein